MTTPTATAPMFESRNHHHGARALFIAALCAALTAGFFANTWRTSVAPAADDTSTAHVCTPTANRAC